MARQVDIQLRNKKYDMTHDASVICPSRWSKSQLLDYCRACHPNETVKIIQWHDVGSDEDPWGVRFWLVNPEEMLKRA
jgi:hypothetical protein